MTSGIRISIVETLFPPLIPTAASAATTGNPTFGYRPIAHEAVAWIIALYRKVADRKARHLLDHADATHTPGPGMRAPTVHQLHHFGIAFTGRNGLLDFVVRAHRLNMEDAL